ncbi:MAG: hypothetical protein F4184_02735, partial [Gemmatimonadetes bacterium]|nr:hypothetical protein [Gemmatimonadota bacterium]
DLQAGDDSVTTVLMLAARGGAVEVVRLLLDNGADIDINKQNNNGWTALMFSADFRGSDGPGGIEVARLLLDNGADVNAQDNTGRTALSFAKKSPLRQRLIDLLEAAGATE